MSQRMRRVNEGLRAVVAEAVSDLHDPRIGFVTITEVRASPDLRTAKVYVSVLGSERKMEATLDGLLSARTLIQERLSHELRMKRTPVLTFEYDPTVERGVALGKLVDELVNDPERHDD